MRSATTRLTAKLSILAAGAAALAACSGDDTREDVDEASSPICSVSYAHGPTPDRGNNAVALAHADFDYEPAVMFDGVYKMWWCSSGGIRYAESSSLDGGWHARNQPVGTTQVVLPPSGVTGSFDRDDVCDPSVVRVNGKYYMYYGANNYTDGGSPYYYSTHIGVASSDDGITWTRLNGHDAIVRPHQESTGSTSGPYGAGQPSVVFGVGSQYNYWYYMVYTDTTRTWPVDHTPRNEVFVILSTDPTFQTNTYELTSPGNQTPYQAPQPGAQFPFASGAGVDWMYVDALDEFALARVESTTQMRVDFYSGVNVGGFGLLGGFSLNTYVNANKYNTEGPGLVRRPDGHALPALPGATVTAGSVGTVPIDMMRSVGLPNPPFPNVATWDLSHVGASLATGRTSDCMDVGRVLEGLQISSTGTPLAVVRQGTRLQFALGAPANDLSHDYYSVDSTLFNAVPYAASLFSGNAGYYVAGVTPGAFLLDDNRLWAVSCPKILTDNNSSLTPTNITWWNAHARGPDLYCIQ